MPTVRRRGIFELVSSLMKRMRRRGRSSWATVIHLIIFVLLALAWTLYSEIGLERLLCKANKLQALGKRKVKMLANYARAVFLKMCTIRCCVKETLCVQVVKSLGGEMSGSARRELL